MVTETEFTANLNADKIYMDLTYLDDPITKKFWLTIQNQSLSTLYFKIICNIPNWSISTPTDGKLGGITSGTTATKTSIITRTNPATETTDSGNLTIEAYTDSDYTNKIGEAALSATVYIEDLENWTDVDKSDFNDGTAQGWTIEPSAYTSITSNYSVEVGGYCVQFLRNWIFDVEVYVSKSVVLPNKNKVRVAFFIGAYAVVEGGIYNLAVLVDGDKVFDIPFTWHPATSYPGVKEGWLKVVADLSAYKGQTITLKIRSYAKITGGGYQIAAVWFDRIVIAGKD